MTNRPRVFLSHSKKEKEFIERIAQDLRKCRIDAWYDDWEISPGKSLRKKIFEEGISDCDAFFVYLTKNSIDSNWVSRELDAAFIEQSKEKNTEILTFVDNNDLIKKLPSDIASIRCPTINSENYEEGFKDLITAIYEAKINAVLKQRNLERENKILNLENEILNLEKEIAESKTKILNSSEDVGTDFQTIEKALNGIIFSTKNIQLSALTIFEFLWPYFSTGLYYGEKVHEITKTKVFSFNEIMAPFLIRNLISNLEDEEYPNYILTDLGKQFASYITMEGYILKKPKKPSKLK